MSKTRTDLAVSVLEELRVRVGEEPVNVEDSAVILRKIDEVMPEVERRGYVIGWRADEIDEIYMDPLSKLVAARSCRKFVMPGEEPAYLGLEVLAWRALAALTAEPYRARTVKASYI